MLKVGLTGGMACGKTIVGKMFARRGGHVIQADQIAHELMRPGEEVYQQIVAAFGAEILAPDSTIDRAKLAQAAFSSARGSGQSDSASPGSRIHELNAIVHPAVIRRQEDWMDEIGRRDPQAVAIVEAALIFEAGLGDHFDKIIVVACDPEQKLERFARRANLNKDAAAAELARRSAAQLPDDEKARRADYVLDNSGSLEQTELQVEQVWAELRESARIFRGSIAP